MNNIGMQPIEVRFSMSPKSTWFDIIFLVGKQGRIVETSESMWQPYYLIYWLECIIKGRENALECEVDREGRVDIIKYTHVDTETCHIAIYGEYDADPLHLEGVISKRQLIWEIYREMKHFEPQLYTQDCRPNTLRSAEIEKWLQWDKCKDRIACDFSQGRWG